MTDGRTNEQTKVPCVLQDFVPIGAAAQKATFTEPPMTLDLSDEELRGLVEKPLFVPPYPCHTQAVERAIKLVSEAAGSVVGADSRDGYIRQKIRSRKEVCLEGSKKNFFPKLKKE